VTDPIADALDRCVPAFTSAEGDWQAILNTATPARVAIADHQPAPLMRVRGARRWSKQLLMAAAIVVALAGAGVAIADGFGAFNGISAAQGVQTPAALQWATNIQSSCPDTPPDAAAYWPQCNLVLPSARLLTTAPDGTNVYIVTDTRGDLCEGVETGWSCGPPLSAAHPITAGSSNPSPTAGGEFTAAGIALDNVTSVSFTVGSGGPNVTVPVKDNVWIYQAPDSHASETFCVQAHLTDGSTVDPLPEVSCS